LDTRRSCNGGTRCHQAPVFNRLGPFTPDLAVRAYRLSGQSPSVRRSVNKTSGSKEHARRLPQRHEDVVCPVYAWVKPFRLLCVALDTSAGATLDSGTVVLGKSLIYAAASSQNASYPPRDSPDLSMKHSFTQLLSLSHTTLGSRNNKNLYTTPKSTSLYHRMLGI
jgi:hypothetical protein